MYDELVKRLRERSVFLFPHHGESRNYDADLMHEAADAIEELQAAEKKYLANIGALETENQHLKREREWIPVTEQLPEKDGTFITAYSKGGVSQNWYMTFHHGGGKWYQNSEDTGEVTHWMPLPTPPTAEEGET